jgi:hypothetical protein
LFNKIVHVLPVQNSVDIFCLEDNEIIEILLGAVNNIIKELDTDTSSRMIYYIAKHIHPTHVCITNSNMSFLKTGPILSFE